MQDDTPIRINPETLNLNNELRGEFSNVHFWSEVKEPEELVSQWSTKDETESENVRYGDVDSWDGEPWE